MISSFDGSIHMVNVEEIWLSRIKEEPCLISLNTQRSLSTLLHQTQQLHQSYKQIVALRSTDQWEEVVSYRNARGMAFNTPLLDVLTHVANHSTHHRGQIVARLRSLGYVPPITDYLHFVQYAKV